MARIDVIQRRVLADSEMITGFWRKYFGKKIDFTWEETPTHLPFSREHKLSEVIKTIIDDSNKHLNTIIENQIRSGDTSLFIREPYNDRLVLAYSTSPLLQRCSISNFKTPKENIDTENDYCYYSLFDRLTTYERDDTEVRKKRGLTGWIAVTGHFLLVNGEQDASSLELINRYRVETGSMCRIYGTPVWGRRMSETQSNPEHPKRYIGVPIKSVSTDELTIGVIRYACPLEGAPLTINDLAFLEEISSIVSAILNLEPAKGRALRETSFAHKISRLKRNANLNEFLSFMSTSFKSQITSVYLDIGKLFGKESQLRLVDAYGIAGSSVAEHRDTLNDYDGQKYEGRGEGLTWKIFSQEVHEPLVEQSVAEANGWGGLNTQIFYAPILPLLGVQHAENSNVIRSTIENYRIKIMGMALFGSNGMPIGVIKVEFPLNFDAEKHYDRNDQEFFKKCAMEITAYLNTISKVISLEKTSDFEQIEKTVYLQYLTEILRTELIKQNEYPEFWKRHDTFLIKNKKDLVTVGNSITRNYADNIKRQIKKAISSLPEEIIKESVKYIFRSLFD